MIRRFSLREVGLLVTAFFVLSACAEAPAPSDDRRRARAVIDSARAAAGAARLDSTVVSFGFRKERFQLRHPGPDGTGFSYRRSFRDSLGRRVRDVLTDDSLRRRVEGRSARLDSATRRQALTTLNSVAYFALLPEPLGDAAVRPRYAGADTIDGVPYHRVAVRFRQEGGGRDWQDRFLYWFDQRDFSMDYLAYAYGLGPGEEYGTRFREAFNTRRRGGIRFADYRNYTTDSTRVDSLPPSRLARYGRLFGTDTLRRVSTVALDSVRVRKSSRVPTAADGDAQ
jgi:hypothetical protein